MKKKTVAVVIILLVGILAWIVALGSNLASKPIRLQEKDCHKPCWLGIEAGRTKKTDVQTVLITSFGVSNFKLESYSDYEKITWVDDFFQGGGTIYLRDEIVDSITVWFSEEKVNVHDVIVEIGEPDYVLVGTPICLGASLIYPELGISASLYPIDTFVGVEEGQSIYSLEFQTPFVVEKWRIYDQTLKKWNSYKNYCND